MSVESAILDAVAAQLATVTGYTATGAVREGEPTPGDLVPGVIWYSVGPVTSTRGNFADMTGYRRELTIQVWVAAASASGSASSRVRAALDAAVQIRAQLELVPTAGGAFDLVTALDAIDGDALGVPGIGVASLAVVAYWLADGGST